MQIVRSTADDVDFSTPNAVDPANNFGTPTGNPLIDTVRYPTHQGLGRHLRVRPGQRLRDAEGGARRPHPTRGDDRQPDAGSTCCRQRAPCRSPATSPRRGPPRTTTASSGLPASSRPLYPATDHWTSLGGGSGLTAPASGTLATLDLASVAAALPANATGTPIDASNHDRPDEERFSVRLRVVVTAHGGDGDGLTGEMQKQVFVHDDPDLASGFPLKIPGVSVSSPRFVDLLRDGRTEMLVATADGEIHAYLPNMSELPGFPLLADASSWWPGASPTAAADGIPAAPWRLHGRRARRGRPEP